MARIFIVEDEPIIAKDISHCLKSAGHDVVGIAFDSESALDILRTKEIDLVLLDINIRGTRNGIEIGSIIQSKYDLPFIYITSFSDDETLANAVATHPYGYIVKPFDEKSLITTISVALHNYKLLQSQINLSYEDVNKNLTAPLSKREYELLIDLSKGLTNEDIAKKHFVSINTVKYHLKNIYTKLDVTSRSAAVHKARS